MLALGVEDMLTHIRRSKLTEGRPVKPSLLSQQQPHHNSTANACLIGEDSGRIKWVQPSGTSASDTAKAAAPCWIVLMKVLAMYTVN